ncbi:cyanate lyase C-terminal domain protein [Mycobacterium xenopi 4042]|uniref:Cyanate lyase C-terminal domain protein n=1 Tax=Mycobacterium xenopi 4042 TaxID=1299334 RepID=X7Z419_MYCXE|nr:cyanate lyase C-terminal domain protein [Mycobacterium xenopi 4042]
MNRNEITEQIVAARLKRVCPGRNSPTRSANRWPGPSRRCWVSSRSRRARQGARGDAGPRPVGGAGAGGAADARRAAHRGATDPTIYRFYEALQVYGPAIKELIHEQFGDGIMSAINFSVDVQKKPHPSGDRVVVTFDGKFLPYEWVAAES